MPLINSSGGGSSQRARTGSSTAPPGTRFAGRAALRSRLDGRRPSLLGGVRLSDDLAVAQLVLDELAHHRVVGERPGEALSILGEGDFHALVDVARGREEAVRQTVQTRVLEVPD